ncbi:MAG TPA: hypothetical protein VMV18_09230, partial [bacterium]|nr:hypothetical protein [bacterium]
EGIAWALRSLGLSRQPDFSAELSALRAPVTLLAGSLDTKFRALHEDLSRRSPLVDARVVEGAGHNLALEAPEAVASAVRALADSLRKERMHA